MRRYWRHREVIGGLGLTPRRCLVISASPDPELPTRIAAGAAPRKDYLLLAAATDGTILYRDAVRSRVLSRLASRLVGVSVGQAILAFLRRREYDSIFTDAENIGLPLALLFKLARVRRRHVMIAHLPSTRWKRWCFRLLRLHSHIDVIIVHASRQRWILEQLLGVPAAQIALLPYGVDTTFWRSAPAPERQLVCSAGLEFRDYPTLIEAVRDLEVDVVIAAASHWSRRRNEAHDVPLPPNVTVTSLDYARLRDLYAQARIVVVPLHDVEFQAGITTILEAMAMAKPLIVSLTRGQRDVVRGPAGLPATGNAAYAAGFGVLEADAGAIGQTGVYVPPGNAAALRAALQQLLDDPAQARELGAQGRLLVERLMSLDQYAARIEALLR